MTPKKLKNSVIAMSALVTASTLSPQRVLAESACQESAGGFLNFPTWYKYIIANPGPPCELEQDLIVNLPKILLAVFEILLRAGGLLAVAMILYGGIQYIISQGEPDKTKGARTTILNAIIGLVITMSAVAIVNLIGKNI